ncbi:MAG: S9 family peptidase, partial [Clostridiales Family XIII bacterium]|nr:S9 family peptidase [Clostridiales Family XIII bacterium]
PEDKAAAAEGGPPTVLRRIHVVSGDETEWFRLSLPGASPIGFHDGNLFLVARWDNAAADVPGKSYGEACRLAKEERVHFRVCDEQTYRHDGMGYINKQRRRLFLRRPDAQEAVPLTPPMFGVEDAALAPTGEIVCCGAEQGARKTLSHGIFAYDPASGDARTLVRDTGYHIFKLLCCGDKVFFWGYKAPENMGFFIEDMLSVPLAGGIPKPECPLETSMGTLFHSDVARLSGTMVKAVGNELYAQMHEGLASRVYRFPGAADGNGCVSAPGESGCGNVFVPVTPETINVSCFDRTEDAMLCVGMEGFALQEIFAERDGVWRKLTAYGDDVNHMLIAPEHLPFACGDGVSADGWVIPPLDYDPARERAYPGILMIHGGPHVAYGAVPFCDAQILAAAGYFVFYCNPRGSGGKGRAFADISGRYGTVDFDDIMRFTDKVLETWAGIDPARLGVTGGSYGGFMTNWIITRTDRFRAAVSQCSIANWFTMYYLSDVPYFVRSEMDGTPHEHPERLWRASPIRRIGEAKTPTLFLQYEMDFRCPMEEALQMYGGLLENGVETRLVMFSGDSHGITGAGTPRHRMRRTREMQAWFDRYLKSERADG